MRTWHRSCMKRTFGQSNDVQAVDAFPLGVWKSVEGMHSFRRWQKMPQWGPIAWIRERAARKRHDGAFSRADILRLSFRKNYVTWPFVELSYSVRAFAGFSLRNEVCREAPLSRFLPSGARDAARFSCDAFRRKVSSSRDWSCFEYHVFYGCEQQKWKHQIGG